MNVSSPQSNTATQTDDKTHTECTVTGV